MHAPLPPIDRVPDAPQLPQETSAAIAERIAARDLPGALDVARAAARLDPEIAEIVAVLARIVVATERLLDEPIPGGGRSTIPLGGHGLALFQLRMGNLADAEQGFRQLVLEHASDGLARERLSDVVLLRRAITGSVDREPTATTPPVGWLDKRNARPAAAGWSVSAKPGGSSRPPPANEWDDEVSTNVIRPEQEAELLLRGGSPERALEIYRGILACNPARAELAMRVSEIERIVSGGGALVFDEATVRRDLSTLGAAPEARRSHPSAPPAPLDAIAADDARTTDVVVEPAESQIVTVRRILAIE